MVRWRGNEGYPGYRVAQTCDEVIDLTPRKLPTLARLSTLCHFNLQHLSINQIMRRDTKSTRSDLLNLGYAIRAIASRVFTTLSAI